MWLKLEFTNDRFCPTYLEPYVKTKIIFRTETTLKRKRRN